MRKGEKAKAGKNKPKNIKTTVVPSVFVPLDQRSGDKRFVKPASPACAERNEDSRYEVA